MFGFKREAKVMDSGFLISQSRHDAAEYIRAYCAQATPAARRTIANELRDGTSAQSVAKSIKKVTGFVA